MRYTVTFTEKGYNELVKHLFTDTRVEHGAYALCRISSSDEETRLLVRKIIPVVDEDILDATEVSMTIMSRSFLRAMKTADETKHVFIFIHSHPNGFPQHSKQDDIEEKKLFKTAYTRIETKGVHGSLVLSSPERPVGRIWLEDGTIQPVSMIRVIGNRFKFYADLTDVDPLPTFFDRQIRAFGADIQKLFRVLHIGIVGVGGTGSSVAEQLIRLGIGKLSISDGQTFEETNVNRVYGSRVSDDGQKKVLLIQRLADEVGLKTKIIPLDKPMSYQSVVNKLKECDVIFGCTDDHWGRSILTRVAVYYQIPVFDMGVKIDSKDEIIKAVEGRVTTLLPNYACLFCRERIDPRMVQSESLAVLDPEQLKELRKAGYIPELEETAPSVIPFTTNIASVAVSELIHHLTGFMGADRITNEVIVRFDEPEIRRNSRRSKPDCFCGDGYYVSRGDTNPLLDSTWRPEK